MNKKYNTIDDDEINNLTRSMRIPKKNRQIKYENIANEELSFNGNDKKKMRKEKKAIKRENNKSKKLKIWQKILVVFICF